MTNSRQDQLIARARAANRTFVDQNLLSQEVKCPTKELLEATKREELRVPLKIPGNNFEKQTFKPVMIEVPAPKAIVEMLAPLPPELAPEWLPSQELLEELSLKVTSAIENSKLTSAKMTEVTRIFNEVKCEIQQPAANWDKVNGLLKKSLDYGLKIAPEIIKIAAIYYQTRVPANPPKKAPKVVEIVVKSKVNREVDREVINEGSPVVKQIKKLYEKLNETVHHFLPPKLATARTRAVRKEEQ